MDVILTYDELSGYIVRHFGKQIELNREGDQSIRAVYRAGLISQSVSLRVAAIEENCLTVAFTGSMLIRMLLKGFRGAINEKLGNGILLYKDHYLIIDLKVIPQTQVLAAAIDIREVSPSDSAIIIRANLK